MITDWPSWPIFIIQLFSIVLFLLPRNLRIFSFLPRTIIITLLLVITIMIVVVLYSHSTDALSLQF